MKQWQRYTPILALALLFANAEAADPEAQSDREASFTPFAVDGEQLEISPPRGWKLGWMAGMPDGKFVVEYVPAFDDINSWSEGYLSLQRFPYPAPDVLEKIKENNSKPAAAMLSSFQDMAKKGCLGEQNQMSVRSRDNNGRFQIFSGGFCDKYASQAPYGEGALIAVTEGQDFMFLVFYAWRPKSPSEARMNMPWRIDPSMAANHMKSLANMALCGAKGQPECKIRYTAPQ